MTTKPDYNIVIIVGSNDIAAYVVTLRSFLVWDLAQHISLTRRFGRAYLLYIQCSRYLDNVILTRRFGTAYLPHLHWPRRLFERTS
jgi:hypothetical protein